MLKYIPILLLLVGLTLSSVTCSNGTNTTNNDPPSTKESVQDALDKIDRAKRWANPSVNTAVYLIRKISREVNPEFNVDYEVLTPFATSILTQAVPFLKGNKETGIETIKGWYLRVGIPDFLAKYTWDLISMGLPAVSWKTFENLTEGQVSIIIATGETLEVYANAILIATSEPFIIQLGSTVDSTTSNSKTEWKELMVDLAKETK